jgi:hypothetical protein
MRTLNLKQIALAIAVFTLCFFTSIAVQAQNGPACLPDCPQSLFTPAGYLPPIDLEVPGQPGCTLRVTYGYRNACGVWHDFFIYNIQAIGSCAPGFLADPNAVVQTATTLLFMSNPPVNPGGGTVGPPKPNCGDVSCVTNWRVIKGSCWRSYPGGIYYECQTTACCLQPYQICRDYCDNITVTSFGAGGGGDCSTGEQGCVSVCN